ncbi:MAG TPA: cupin domain-containing protein [Rhizobium sp.]|nr:cupin domain-containing protein [Rhizobium sp.]
MVGQDYGKLLLVLGLQQTLYPEFPADAPPSEPHRHGSAEFIYVLSGRLSVDVDGEENVLHASDAIYFDSGVPHSDRREGVVACKALVVTAP